MSTILLSFILVLKIMCFLHILFTLWSESVRDFKRTMNFALTVFTDADNISALQEAIITILGELKTLELALVSVWVTGTTVPHISRDSVCDANVPSVDATMVKLTAFGYFIQHLNQSTVISTSSHIQTCFL